VFIYLADCFSMVRPGRVQTVSRRGSNHLAGTLWSFTCYNFLRPESHNHEERIRYLRARHSAFSVAGEFNRSTS
jgi:hypothetical protein